MLKKALTSGARAVAHVFESSLESGSATIEINGERMSAKEFKEWRVRRRSRAQGMLKGEEQRRPGRHHEL
jgi:hypothetical protein